MKALFGILVVAVAAYLAFMFIPPYFSKYQFSDDITSIARFAGPTQRTEEDIRTEVMQKAKGYNLPITPEQVRVSREGQKVTIGADYTYVVNLVGGKQVPIEFHLVSDK